MTDRQKSSNESVDELQRTCSVGMDPMRLQRDRTAGAAIEAMVTDMSLCYDRMSPAIHPTAYRR
eukprot:scaffold1307_cov151-Amphora_coffeaeformis.AAC.3